MPCNKTRRKPGSGILMMAVFEKSFVFYTDAYHEGLGSVLFQVDENKRCRPNVRCRTNIIQVI